MYSRSYSDEADSLAIPEGYGGTSMTLGIHNDEAPEPKEIIRNDPADSGGESVSAGLFSGIFPKLPFGNILGGIFGNGKFGLSKIGTEELLIIAAAIFLFFSGDGDRECAILLVLLLFIN